MLTKDLLKYSIRGDKIFPKYIKTSEPLYQDWAKDLEDRFRAQVGGSYRELQEQLQQHPKTNDIVFQGLCKLIEDRCEFSEAAESLEEQRWKWMKVAQDLRGRDFASYRDFQQALAYESGQDFSLIEEQLYGDLGENRTLISMRALGVEGLLHRYNLAQVQGLLMRAQTVQFKIRSDDIAMRRRLLQRLRFCRLMAEFTDESEKGLLTLKISGPLSLFEQAQGYGLRLCHFFPYTLLFDNWELEAEVRLGEKRVQLLLDSGKPMRSHYQGFSGYIPEELTEFIGSFNQLEEKKRLGWKVAEGRESLNLGQQNYSVPDLSFTHVSGAVHHVELFHRWHQGELLRRLETFAQTTPPSFLGVGLAKEILKNKDIEERLAQIRQGAVSIFTFGQFPTIKAILTYLAKVKVAPEMI